jgi:predicted ATPase
MLDVLERPDEPPFVFTADPRAFTYLCAERLGPRSMLGASALPVDALELGVRGEYCAQVLAALGDRPIEHRVRRHPNQGSEVARLLKYELEDWLGEIVRPVQIGTEPYPGGVENPEAHLHPAGQSRIGTFLAWLAGRGVQTIVETHSDHVLNGVRWAIGEYGKDTGSSSVGPSR